MRCEDVQGLVGVELLQIKQLAGGTAMSVAEGAVRAAGCHLAASLLAVTQVGQSFHGFVRADRPRLCAAGHCLA